MFSRGRLDLFVDYLEIVADRAGVFAIIIQSIFTEPAMHYLCHPYVRQRAAGGSERARAQSIDAVARH